MAKKRIRKDDPEQVDAFQDRIRARLSGLFGGIEEPPAYLNIREIEALKAHVNELEAELAQKTAPEGTRASSMHAEPNSRGGSSESNAQHEERAAKANEKQAANALRITWIGLPASIVAASFYLYLAIQIGAWQLYAWSIDMWVLALAVFAGMLLVRRGRTSAGMWTLLSAIEVTFLVAVALIQGLGLLLGISMAVLVSVIAGQTLSGKASNRAIILGAASGVIAVLADLFAPPYRFPEPDAIRLFLPAILGVVIVLFGIVTIRQFANYSLRTKLVLSFVVISVASVGSLAFFVDRAQRASRTNDIGENMAVLANAQASQVGQVIENEFNLLNSLALTRAVQERAATATELNNLSESEIAQLDKNWQAADAANNNNDPLVADVLYDGLSPELIKFQASYPEHVEIFLTDLKGVSIATTDRTSDYLQSDEAWWQAAYKDGMYIGQPEFDASSKTLAINMAVPVRARWSNQIVGVLRTTVNITSLSNVLISGRFGKTGTTEVYLPSKQDIGVSPIAGGKYELKVSDAGIDAGSLGGTNANFQELSINGVPNLVSNTRVSTAGDSNLSKLINALNWYVVVHQEKADALLPVETQTRNSLFLAIIVAVLAAIAAVVLAQALASPLIRLNEFAQKVSSGDLTVTAKVEAGDETGTLATTFNNMVSQLRGLVGSLEQRVADRTHDLELAAEVGRQVSERSTDITDLLTRAVDLIRERFNLYYAQIYLVDQGGHNLILRAGTGETGAQLLSRAHHLPIASTSINGRAANEEHSVIVADTKESANFLPNPLLPNTRSEMATPLIAGGQVVGVLDMQSEQPGSLNEGNLLAFEAMAGQLAIAIQNAALLTETEQARSDVEAQVHRLTETGWQGFLDAIERGEKLGFGFDSTGVARLAGENISEAPVDAFSTPIMVTGTKIGRIQLTDESDRAWTAGESDIIQATADQLAQHIENLRLLAQMQRYQAQAEEVARRLTGEGWNALQDRGNVAPGYVYDLNEVKQLGKNHKDASDGFVKQPLRVHNENIGELAVDGGGDSEGATEIITAVAEQLSGHIENLRLADINEKRAYELATVATVSTTASTVLDPDQLLQSVVDLTKERFGLYHAHIYLADDSWKTLLLAAGAGEVGREMVAEEHSIALDAERSLVACAARERHEVIVNDVHGEQGFLPNPLLPNTNSEMAVPMIAGDKVLGVFDVQSDKRSGFSQEDASIYTTLASQVAVALQNARLYVAQSATVTQLRELDRLKSSFLANMSHELRTPLNSILGFSDVILEQIDGPITEPMENDLQLIQKNGQHLLHLINDVLDMAKIEAGRFNLSPEKFVVHEVLDDALSITSTLASEKHLSIFVEGDSENDVEIFADRTRLRQVMINLINNSIKFTEKGSISIRTLRQGADSVLISVRDTGIGIPVDKLETIFQEFAQIDTSTTRKTGGTGLGLPISRRLIALHGGRLWAESAGVGGGGSVFYVELPLEARMVEPVESMVR